MRRCNRLIIDGRHLLWRTADAHKDLSVDIEGVDVPTGGIYGFLCVAIRVHARYGGRVVVTWEGQHGNGPHVWHKCDEERCMICAGHLQLCTACHQAEVELEPTCPAARREPNFRFGLFPAYKGKQEAIPAERLELITEMMDQEDRLRLMLTSMGVEQYMGIGCEGDDVVGRLSMEWSSAGQHVYVYSGDSDLRQLVREEDHDCGLVYVVAPETKKGRGVQDRVYNRDMVVEKHGVTPERMASLKALVGGKDNLPGVPGVGKKSGVTLINHYGSLTDVLRAARAGAEDWPLSVRLRDAVAVAALDVITYYRVAKVRCDLGVELIEPLASQRMFLKQLTTYRFRSLMQPSELHSLMAMGE